MSIHYGQVSALALVVALAGCTSTTGGTETAQSVEPSVAPISSPSPTEEAPAFPTEAFADISDDAVSRTVAAEFQAALIDMADAAVIEQVRERPIHEVLRDGVLSIDGVDRLIYQPGG